MRVSSHKICKYFQDNNKDNTVPVFIFNVYFNLQRENVASNNSKHSILTIIEINRSN